MKRLEHIDAKAILEDGFADFDGLTRPAGVPAAMPAGGAGSVVHEMTFCRAPGRPIRALVLALRTGRYLKGFDAVARGEVDVSGRFALRHNDTALAFDLMMQPGKQVASATRAASQFIWLTLDFGETCFRAGDNLRLALRLGDGLRVPVLAIRYTVPLFLLDADGQYYTEEPVRFDVTGAGAAKLCVDVPSIVHGERVRLRVAALDWMGNLARDFSDVLVCRLAGQEARIAAEGGLAESDELAAPAGGVHYVEVAAAASGLEGRSNCFVADPEMRFDPLFWGDIHGHSILSDGVGSPGEHYAYSRDVRFMDVAAVTDHDNQIIANGSWPYIQRQAREWSEPGRFVVLPAYEWAQPYHADENYGHKNFYFRTYADNPLLSGDVADGTDAETPEKLYPKLPGDCVVISHHPAYEHWMWTDWDRVDPSRESVVEVYSTHGASDEVETIKPLHDFNEGRFIFKNLRERPGLKLGFVGGSDCHAGLLALDFHSDRAAPEDGATFKKFRGGITAFSAPRLTLDSLLDALRERRVYATTGEKLLLLVEVNGRAFEPEQEGQGGAGLRITFGGTCPVRRLDIYRDAALVHSVEGLDDVFEYRWRDAEFEPPSAYFVRVTQQDDQMAWSAVTYCS